MLRALIVALAMMLAPSVRALESAPVTSARTTVTLVSEVASVAAGQTFRVALRQQLAPGWHTYWINAGDAGEPPEVKFTLPEGAGADPLRFPSPHRIPVGPLVNFGYEHEAVFTAAIVPPAALPPGRDFVVEARATWLVCERICIPEEGVFRLILPAETTSRSDAQAAPLFAAAEAAQPRPSPWPARIAVEDRTARLTLTGADFSPASVREAFFFPADWGLIDNAAPQAMAIEADALSLSLRRGEGPVPSEIKGVVAIVDGAGIRSAYAIAAAASGALAAPAPSASAVATPAAAAPPPALWLVALWAMLGGLILNLMPCVFPILAIKAFGLARLSGGERGAVRAHALSYTGGVVLSFVALAGLLLVLRATGAAAGWGFQFTSPVFVALMAWLMLGVGLNLSGVFQIQGSFGVGSGLADKEGHAGSFATGVLAVLVATPCTAPFMAAAIAAALALPAYAALAVFAAMGLGMAAPYALLAVLPGAARLLPRPGAWMERMKQALAFPMYAAAAWLVWVAAQQAGEAAVFVLLAGAVLVGFASWLVGIMQAGTRPGLRLGHGLALAALVGALALLPGLSDSAAPRQARQEAGIEPWSAARVAALRAEGRPVFVNLTAAWCITCKVNERVALKAPAVEAAFASRRIAHLQGDWTSGDPAITELLRANGREGVPLYLYFAAGQSRPAILPQILTEGIVLEALGADQG